MNDEDVCRGKVKGMHETPTVSTPKPPAVGFQTFVSFLILHVLLVDSRVDMEELGKGPIEI